MKEFKPTEWVALIDDPNRWVSYEKLQTFEQNREPEFKEDQGGRLLTVQVSEMLRVSDVCSAQVSGEARAEVVRHLKLFISYAHEDEKWRAKFAPNLALLEREGLVEVWCDLKIKAGDDWDDEIKRKLNEADIFLFLMSTDLLASKYVQDVELPIARMRHEGKTARIIPVVVRACSWTRFLGDIQGLPTGAVALKEWRDKDQAFHDVETGLRNTIAEVKKLRERT